MNLRVELYHNLRHSLQILFGTRFNELVWRFRHIYKRDWAEESIRSFSHPHRQLLVRKILSNKPLTRVLEIGCASGPNLYMLARRFPNVHCVGIDINPEAIRQGTEFFRKQKINNVSLHVGKADDLERFPDESFDVVFTDAVLMYVCPDKIKKVATEIMRVSRKAIILAEHCSIDANALGTYQEKWWLRDYLKLFQSFGLRANVAKIPPEIWGGNWGRFGYIIEIKKPSAETAKTIEETPIYVDLGEQVPIPA